MIIISFFILHWVTSVVCQTFFLHRYAAHQMFTMSKGWERFFHFMTYLTQGSSYLNPRGYAILHRMHHAYSDTEKDPHSPHVYTNLWTMMWKTKILYDGIIRRKIETPKRYDHSTPEWPALDRFALHPISAIMWVAAYTTFYYFFATEAWMWVLLPAHFIMGPIHGAIVNWAGHKYGYQNFEVGDKSRNTLAFDFLTMGELFQNNHHKYGSRPNFAVRWFEIDPTWQLIKLASALKIIKLAPSEVPMTEEDLLDNTAPPSFGIPMTSAEAKDL
jgi:stearoyl-CoA desaturase (delta-9 desaturase)